MRNSIPGYGQHRGRDRERLERFTLRDLKEAMRDLEPSSWDGATHGGASSSITHGDAGTPHGNQRGPREETCTASQPASMATSRGANGAQKAMPIHARVETKVLHGDASGGESLDAAYRQSQPLEQSRVGRSGAIAET